MRPIRVLDLFSGIGGFSYGLELAGDFRTVAFCEAAEYPRKVLSKHWPSVPIHEDARELNGNEYKGSVDVICGGFPCQPFSTAAAGKNPPDTLSQEFGRIVWQAQPRYVIAENTERKAFSEAFVGGLRALNYSVTPCYIPASQAGAPHDRGRWWVIAHPHDSGQFQRAIDAEASMLSEVCGDIWGAEAFARAVRVSDGLPHRVDRIRCLGNAVVPHIVAAIGRAILAVDGG